MELPLCGFFTAPFTYKLLTTSLESLFNWILQILSEAYCISPKRENDMAVCV